LFSYILTLTSAGFSKEESRECIEIINKYVLREPLSEDELEVILRDEAFPADTFFDGKKFLHNNFAEFLKNNDCIKRIYGQLHVYRDGGYVSGTREIQRAMIKHIPTMKDTQRSEVLKYLDLICEPTNPDNNANLIAFGNGLFDIVSGELREYSPEVVITNKIPWEYDRDAYSELADKTLDKIACGNHDIRALLEECIGYCFYRRNELSKSFMLTGCGSNGKSVFLDMVKNVLGEGNYSALDLNELDERFSVATMAGKLANIGDDISDEFLQGRAVANFKKLVSGNQVKAEIKNDPNIFFMKPTVKLLFSANDIPVMKDRTGAVLRRMIIIPFNAKFSKNDSDYDPYITWKLKDEQVMKYLIRIGIEGLKRVLESNGFTESKEVTEELEEFELRNNPILSFIKDTPIEAILNQPTKEVFRMYKVYCVEKGFLEMTQPNFSRELNRRLDVTVKRVRINGELTGIYVRK
jgi:phage/plasmid primase, P4 family, C-terminal domain